VILSRRDFTQIPQTLSFSATLIYICPIITVVIYVFKLLKMKNKSIFVRRKSAQIVWLKISHAHPPPWKKISSAFSRLKKLARLFAPPLKFPQIHMCKCVVKKLVKFKKTRKKSTTYTMILCFTEWWDRWYISKSNAFFRAKKGKEIKKWITCT